MMIAKSYLPSTVKFLSVSLGIPLALAVLMGESTFAQVPVHGSNQKPIDRIENAPTVPIPGPAPGSNQEPLEPEEDETGDNFLGEFIRATIREAIRNSRQRSREDSSLAEVHPSSPPPTVDLTESRLNQWGLDPVDCLPGAVFIKGLAARPVCVEPTPTMPAGVYSYQSDTHSLILESES